MSSFHEVRLAQPMAILGRHPASSILRHNGGADSPLTIKHNPVAYFQSVHKGAIRGSSLRNIAGFAGARGRYADLARDEVPTLSFIATNQCDDQHGRGNGDAFCEFDQGTTAPQGLTDGGVKSKNFSASQVWKYGYN